MNDPKNFATRLVELVREGELRGAMIRRRDQLLAELAGLTAEISGMPPGNRHDRRANAKRLRVYLNKKGTTR